MDPQEIQELPDKEDQEGKDLPTLDKLEAEVAEVEVEVASTHRENQDKQIMDKLAEMVMGAMEVLEEKKERVVFQIEMVKREMLEVPALGEVKIIIQEAQVIMEVMDLGLEQEIQELLVMPDH